MTTEASWAVSKAPRLVTAQKFGIMNTRRMQRLHSKFQGIVTVSVKIHISFIQSAHMMLHRNLLEHTLKVS